ncbi:MAG TPA: sigma-70 family RNA polymerase sigma factor [Gaiellaceae bacterium]|nr:sigma-70 family RNA polymerase sigma factor [Gaiellaceae bacterium]
MRGSRRRLVELETLYRERWSAFARVAISIAGSVELGKEAVQDGFARAIERRDEFRGECPLEAWVWRIVVNTAKTAGMRAARDDQRTAIGTEGAATNGSRPSEVALWVRNLPERQREAVFLRYWADLDYRAIAEVLEVEVGTVSATLSAAHQSLRRSVQEVQR